MWRTQTQQLSDKRATFCFSITCAKFFINSMFCTYPSTYVIHLFRSNLMNTCTGTNDRSLPYVIRNQECFTCHYVNVTISRATRNTDSILISACSWCCLRVVQCIASVIDLLVSLCHSECSDISVVYVSLFWCLHHCSNAHCFVVSCNACMWLCHVACPLCVPEVCVRCVSMPASECVLVRDFECLQVRLFGVLMSWLQNIQKRREKEI